MDNVSEFKVGDILVGYSGMHWFYRVLKVSPKSMKVILLETNKIERKGTDTCEVKPKFSSPSWVEAETAKRKWYGDQEVLYIPHSRHAILGKFDDKKVYLDLTC